MPSRTPKTKSARYQRSASFNERHGPEFTDADFIRYQQVTRNALDDDMADVLRNNPPDVAYPDFSEAFFKESIRSYQRDSEMQSIVLTDAEARDEVIRFFNWALRELADGPQVTQRKRYHGPDCRCCG